MPTPRGAHIDFETYSEANLKQVGAWAYAAHPSTRVICMAIGETHSDETPTILTRQDQITAMLELLLKSGSVLHAWNSFFEMAICHNTLKVKGCLNVEQWHDTAADAAALALPRSLGECATVLGLPADKQKDERGRYLISKLSKPQKSVESMAPYKKLVKKLATQEVNTSEWHATESKMLALKTQRAEETEALIQEFYAYCVQDVVVERTVSRKLPRKLSKLEQRVWMLDQKLNSTGVPIDSENVENAIEVAALEVAAINARISVKTQGFLNKVSQRQKVLDYSAELGYPLKDYTKPYITEVLEDCQLPPILREIIQARLDTGKTSIAKYSKFKQVSVSDRVYGMLMYHGATTGRWTGKLVQLQNLPRPTIDTPEQAIGQLKHTDNTWIDFLYGNTMEVLSSCIRSVIKAPAGMKLLVADYSQIEARVLPWLAGQHDTLDIFVKGKDVYKHTATQIYRKSYGEIDKAQRFVGKVATLALGYGGGVKAFQNMAEAYGQEISEELADKIKTDWRGANSNIVKYWKLVNLAAINAVKNVGGAYEVGGVTFKVIEGYLTCRLPSGRLLSYPRAGLGVGRFGGECVTFWGNRQVMKGFTPKVYEGVTETRTWRQLDTYGGKLVENVTQAVARDIMAEAMLRLESAGYKIILTVHDEVVIEATPDQGVSDVERIMCEELPWSKGLPIAAEGYESQRYKK